MEPARLSPDQVVKLLGAARALPSRLLELGDPPKDFEPHQIASWLELGAFVPVSPSTRAKFITAVQLHAATRKLIEELAVAPSTAKPKGKVR